MYVYTICGKGMAGTMRVREGRRNVLCLLWGLVATPSENRELNHETFLDSYGII